jgi:hypothetical protein
MNQTKRKMPTIQAINRMWVGFLIHIGRIKKRADVHRHFCWVCGYESDGPMERAHILARQDGGGDGPENIHMLCSTCHRQSEFLNGGMYFMWFCAPSENERFKVRALSYVQWRNAKTTPTDVEAMATESPDDAMIHLAVSEMQKEVL